MKRLSLLGILILTGVASMLAQDYQSYVSGRSACFSHSNYGLKFQKIDSTTVHQGDSIMWFFPNFDLEDYYCIKPNGPNWSGRMLLIRENGDNVFFNRNNDSITIKTQAGLNTSWLAYQNTNDYRIFAEVTKHDTLSFLTLTDSVKTISFQVFDNDNNPLEHPLNSKKLKISKNYGLINTLLFRDFPDFNFEPSQQIEYTLAGISDPEIGIQNLTWKEIYDDFYPGDEQHIKAEDCYGSIIDLQCTEEELIVKYLTRTDYPDSIVYTMERTMEIKKHISGNFQSYTFFIDTVKSRINLNLPYWLFDRFSEETTFTNENTPSFNLQETISIGSGITARRKTLNLYSDLEIWDENCWTYPISDVITTNPRYVEGLGGPYYSGSLWDSYTTRQLVYYKKGTTESGTPLNIINETDISSVSSKTKFAIYPNPAKEFIWIQTETKGFYQLEIMDVSGRVILSELINSNQQQINISHLKPGIYIYAIRNSGLNYTTGKLAVH